MPGSNWRQQRSPSPKASMQPPLSKFYHGPVNGWNSAESSPSHNGSTFSLNSVHESAPPLPPRNSPGPSAHSSPQISQGWRSPAPLASTISQLSSVYTSNIYTTASRSGDSALNPTWDSDPPDTSSWGVNHRDQRNYVPNHSTKPPLPPRPHKPPDQHDSSIARSPSFRVSTTTIDVPLFLQPPMYDSAAAPPLPKNFVFVPRGIPDRVTSGPKPQPVPPPTPQKIPLETPHTLETPGMTPRRPQYDPQHSSVDGQQHSVQRLRRPRFDPQQSHDGSDSPHPDRKPTIPIPEFTNFDVESALPPRQYDHEELVSQPNNQPRPTWSSQASDVANTTTVRHFTPSSIALVGSVEQDPWKSRVWTGDAQASHIASLEQTLLVPPQDDEEPTVVNDASLKNAGNVVQELQMTSNTLQHESQSPHQANEELQRGDDSFYWHSGRSSSDADEELSQSSSPILTRGEGNADQRSSTTNSTVVRREDHDLPIRSTSLSPSMSESYGASALGFGGPSDWEYFGDYEAEEIDDEELYSRPRRSENGNTILGSVELPADHSPIDRGVNLSNDDRISRPELTAQEDLHMLAKDPSKQSERGRVSSQGLKPLKRSEHTTEGLSHIDSEPVTPRPVFVGNKAPSNHSPGQRPDLDEVIRAWSEAPSIGKVDKESPPLQANGDSRDRAHGVNEPADRCKPGRESFHKAPSPDNALILPDVTIPADEVIAQKSLHQHESDTSTKCRVNSFTSQEVKGQEQQTYTERPLEQSSSLPTLSTIESQSQSPDIDRSLGQTDTTLKPDSTEALPKKIENSSSPSHKAHMNSVVVYSLSDNLTNTSEITEIYDKVKQSTLDINTQISMPPAIPSLQTYAGSQVSSTPEKISEMAPSSGQTSSMQNVTIAVPRDHLPRYVSSEHCTEAHVRGPHDALDAIEVALLKRSHSEAPVKDDMQNDDVEKLGAAADAEAPCAKLEGATGSPQFDESSADGLTISGTTDTDAPVKPQPVRSCDLEKSQQLIKHSASSHHLQQHPKTLPETEKSHDPYADLDPWGKASLNRFAAMLREESRAETNKDKLNIFNVFTSRETRLRVVLYGNEDELMDPQRRVEQVPANHKGLGAASEPEVIQHFEQMSAPENEGLPTNSVHRANTLSLQRSLKALPALPLNRDSIVGPPENKPAPLIAKDSSNSPMNQAHDETKPFAEGAQYSPGGRSIAMRLSKEIISDRKDALSGSLAASNSATGAEDVRPEAPITIESKSTVEVVKKPVYAPPKFRDPRSEVNNYLANRKSIVRPFANLTQGSLDRRSSFGKISDVDNVPKVDTAIKAPTSQYHTASNPRDGDCLNPMTEAKTAGQDPQLDLRRFVKADFDPLLSILPQAEADVAEPARLNELRGVMDNIPDDFSFIHQSVVAWDTKARKQREANDRQRHIRQIESEQRIDSLFDDHEIGYGDISELESEFKRIEAARKADEDRSEYQLFVSDVFTLVWTHLHYELDQLIPHYEQYSTLMNDTLAGKDMFEASSHGLALAPTMNLLLTLHQKLEIRHQKAFEAVLERDRRLKKTEVSPWYTLSNIAKVKQLERQFEDAEKKAIIEYCQQRNARANRLMDVLDQNTLRGVGANQDYMEALWKAVRRIASGRAFASVAGSNEPRAGIEEVEKAKSVTAVLATSSEQIVQTFHVADMLLNSADYEVSVARAKVANKMDLAGLAKLKEERAKEDQKLMRDLEHRLALIREDTRRTNDEIVKLLLFLGVTNGKVVTAADTGPGDLDHEARLQKALEEAKRRNAMKISED